MPASASPLPAAGVPQVVLVSRESLLGVALDGKPLWSLPLTSSKRRGSFFNLEVHTGATRWALDHYFQKPSL